MIYAVILALLFSGCGAVDNDRLLAAALLMQGQANRMGPVSTGTTICRPLPDGAVSCMGM